MTLQLINVGITHGDEVILKDISFEFEPGRIYILMGRTSAGKTSLMRAVAGLLELTEGEMRFRDKAFDKLPTWKRNTSMVYQQFINYPNRTVLENVTFPLLRSGISKQEARTKAMEMIDKVGLTDFINRKPGELSGGQQQRVAIARALIRNADILLLDEPLMNLDYKLREQLREEFRGLFRSSQHSITLYATTEPAEAMLIGDELLVMHEGQVIQHGKPAEVFEHPNSVTVAQIVNEPPMTILSARIADGILSIGGILKTEVPAHLAAVSDGDYLAGYRAGELTVGREGDLTEEGTVDLVEVAGSETLIYLNTATGYSIVQEEGIHEYHAGQTIGISIPPHRTFLFEASGELIVAPGN
ncbi:MAG: ABC transporter ATP-binding protein [Nocardioides sp.]